MKLSRWCALLLCFLAFHLHAHAQCGGQSCVTSASSSGDILGDQSHMGTSIINVWLSPGATDIGLYLGNTAPLDKFYCDGGGTVSPGQCIWRNVGSGSHTVTVSYTGRNYGTTNLNQTFRFSIGSTAAVLVSFNVTPAVAPSETPDQNPDSPCPGSGCGGSPINFANGDTWIPQTDYSIPGLAGGLNLTRTWNSLWPLLNPPETSGIFGDSWRSNFEERLQSLSGGVVKYWKGNGSALFYLYNAQSGYTLTAPLDDPTTLSYNSVTLTSTITQKDGTQRIFNSGGYLTSIIDRNGNTTTIVVDGANQNRIASVTDAGGRTLTFNYATPNFPRLCSSIQDSVGTAANYTYDTSGRLTQVAYPDGSQFNFSYNDPNSTTLISQVTDSLGKVIEAHGYDSQRRGLNVAASQRRQRQSGQQGDGNLS